MRKGAVLPLALLASGLFAADADKPTRRPRIRFGGVVVNAGYSHWSGYPGYGYYGAWVYPAYFGWYPYFHHPFYASGFAQGPNMGEVKLQADTKDGEVFLDGAFAGTASERKSMWLEPGAYNLEVRAPGKETYSRRIYVLSGKSLRVKARFP